MFRIFGVLCGNLPNSYNKHLYNKSIKLLTYGKHKSIFRKYKGLIRQSLVKIK